MKQATITLPDDLEKRLQAYRSSHESEITVSEIVQSALENFLRQQAARARVELVDQPLSITPAEGDSGATDVSVDHDRYFEQAERDTASA